MKIKWDNTCKVLRTISGKCSCITPTLTLLPLGNGGRIKIKWEHVGDLVGPSLRLCWWVSLPGKLSCGLLTHVANLPPSLPTPLLSFLPFLLSTLSLYSCPPWLLFFILFELKNNRYAPNTYIKYTIFKFWYICKIYMILKPSQKSRWWTSKSFLMPFCNPSLLFFSTLPVHLPPYSGSHSSAFCYYRLVFIF